MKVYVVFVDEVDYVYGGEDVGEYAETNTRLSKIFLREEKAIEYCRVNSYSNMEEFEVEE